MKITVKYNSDMKDLNPCKSSISSADDCITCHEFTDMCIYLAKSIGFCDKNIRESFQERTNEILL